MKGQTLSSSSPSSSSSSSFQHPKSFDENQDKRCRRRILASLHYLNSPQFHWIIYKKKTKSFLIHSFLHSCFLTLLEWIFFYTIIAWWNVCFDGMSGFTPLFRSHVWFLTLGFKSPSCTWVHSIDNNDKKGVEKIK